MTADGHRKMLAEFASGHFRTPVTATDLAPICRGASGRTITRLKTGGSSWICIGWTSERADNNSFIPVAGLLRANGVKVPAILAHGRIGDYGMAIVSDLGDLNLLSYRETPWSEKKNYYRQALEEVHRLHSLEIPDNFELQPEFDASLYRWEQEYFATHYLKNWLHVDNEPFLSHPDVMRMAQHLASLPRQPLHRDFQSQNIHIVEGEAWLIDFQGMRMGLPEYDLASILHDPYARLTNGEIAELLELWQTITGRKIDHEILNLCSLQRIMQALGAYARHAAAGHSWYEGHIGRAAATLREISLTSRLAEPLRYIVECGLPA